MIKSASLPKLLEQYEFVPQAIIAATVNELAKRYGGKVEKGRDDLDWYEGSGGLIYGTRYAVMPFTLMHYDGHPDSTSTIYLPFELQKLDEITTIILQISKELGVAQEIKWQRKDEFKIRARVLRLTAAVNNIRALLFGRRN
jgi:hypothetical protein